MDEKTVTKNDWDIEVMPKKTASFLLCRSFTPEQMSALRRGHIPQEMEDKWFWYMENETLFAHRSWSGICIYSIEFKADGNHLVTVNRDPDQYNGADPEEERRRLNFFLDRWAKPEYDYYDEWISETIDAINMHNNAEI